MTSLQQDRKATNLSLDRTLIFEAKSLGINISRAAENGLREAVLDARRAQWKSENSAALRSSNDWVDEHGLPLAEYRPF
jgi:antitoxin CcdA